MEGDENAGLSGILAALLLSDNECNEHQDMTSNIISIDAVQTSVQQLLESQFSKPHKCSPPEQFTSTGLLSRTSLPSNAHDRKQFLLLDSIESEVHEITILLEFDNPTLSEIEMRTILNSHAQKIYSIGILLANSIKDPTGIISSRKEKVLETLRSADSCISQLGALIPNFESVVPIRVDSSKALIIYLSTCTKIGFFKVICSTVLLAVLTLLLS